MEQTQDDEYIDKSSEVGRLILRVNQLVNRPTLDNCLSEILDSFLQALVRSEDFLLNGIFKLNFAEAALLLQSSALVYSKKVDLLWDTINECQKRLVSYKTEENKEEIKRIEERERKYKRRRRQIEAPPNKDAEVNKSKSFQVDWDDVNDFQHSQFEKDSKLYSGWYKKMVFKWDLQPTPKCNRTFVDKQIQFRSPDNAIFDQDQDNEFVAYTSKMQSVIELEEMLLPEKPTFTDFSFQLYTELYLIPKFLRENHLSYEDLEKHLVEIEKFIEYYKDQHFLRGNRYANCYDSTKDRQTPQKLRRISISSTIASRVDMADLDNIYVKKCQVNLLRLSVDDLSRLSRLSVDEVKKSFSCCGEKEDSKTEHFQEHLPTESKVYTDYDTADSSPQITGGKEVEINISSTGELSESLESVENPDTNEVGPSSSDVIGQSRGKERTKRETLKSQVGALLNATTEIVQINKHTGKRKKSIQRITNNVEMPQKRRKLSEAAIKKLATGITVDFKEFNSFFAIHYQPEEGEGSVEIPEFTFDDPLDSSSVLGPGEEQSLCQLSDHPVLCTQDSGYESQFQDTTYHDGPTIDEMITPLPEIAEEEITEESPIMGNCTEEKEKPLYQRVYEWKEYMSGKFKQMQSSDFDIHEYGSNIMESFEADHPQKFSNVVKGKSAAEVTRFFISALQLANTSNIEIQGAKSGQLSNETFQLKLISKERYYDRLKDYMAPSEQDYHERLNSAHQMHRKRSFPSTSGKSCSVKRNKYQ